MKIARWIRGSSKQRVNARKKELISLFRSNLRRSLVEQLENRVLLTTAPQIHLGEIYTDSIGVVGDVDTYRLSLQESASFYVDLDVIEDGLSVDWEISNPYRTIVSNNVPANGLITLTAGDYLHFRRIV